MSPRPGTLTNIEGTLDYILRQKKGDDLALPEQVPEVTCAAKAIEIECVGQTMHPKLREAITHRASGPSFHVLAVWVYASYAVTPRTSPEETVMERMLTSQCLFP